MVTALYNEEESKPFPFDHCIKIIKECPIFTSMKKELLPPENYKTVQNWYNDDVEITNMMASMGAYMKSPVGQKVAK